MGRTPKPLKILVIGLPYNVLKFEWEELNDLVAQGHEVHNADSYVFDEDRAQHSDYDLVLGPTCWLMDEQHRKYLDLAIKTARARRYPKEKE